MKVNKKDFAYFIKRCKYWLALFQLDNWEVDFYCKDIESSAKLNRNYMGCRASIYLNENMEIENGRTIKQSIDINAKHECTHLLVSNLAGLAHIRYVQSDEIDKTEEELIVKLQGIIK